MNALLACLDMQSAALAEFLQTLDDEAGAMNAGEFKRLPALVERKTQLARQITELDRERERLQHEARFDPERPPRPGQETLLRAWQQLRERATQARESNHRNGVMVHTLLDFTRQAITVMHGGNRPLYGSDGRHPTGAKAGKPLGQG